MARRDDELLGRVLRRFLDQDDGEYWTLVPYQAGRHGLCLDGTVTVTKEEAEAIRRVGPDFYERYEGRRG